MGGAADRLVAEAEEALRGQDPERAALSLVKALALAPAHPRAGHLLGDLVDQVEEAPHLIDVERSPEAGLALRAFVFRRRGEVTDALRTLLALLEHNAASPFVAWALDLMGKAGPKADPEQLVLFLGTQLARAPGLVVTQKRSRQKLEALVPLAEAALPLLSEDPGYPVLLCALYRKVGRLDEATDLAQVLESEHPSWKTAIAAAMVHRAAGRAGSALAAYGRAVTHEPDDRTARLDAADLLLELDRLEEADRLYEEVLALDPAHPWAEASRLFIRAVQDPTGIAEQPLQAFARARPDNERAGALAQELVQRRVPFTSYLPRPRSALLDVVAEAPPATGLVSVELGRPPAPSAWIAVRLQLQQLDLVPSWDVSLRAIPSPDPRAARRALVHELWVFEGPRAVPCTDPAPHALTSLVQSLAAGRGDLRRLFARCQEAASLHQPDPVALLSVVGHPPPPLGDLSGWEWLQRVQTSAAFLLATLPGPWEGSPQRDALLSLAWGPDDWSVDAALAALAHAANARPDIASDVRGLFRELLGATPPAADAGFAYALVLCALALPNLGADERRRLAARRLALEQLRRQRRAL